MLILYGMICGFFLLCAKGVSDVVDTWAANEPLPRDHTIIIDAGHGGEDGGATSVSGMLESQLNLEISLRLRDLLHFLGNDTKMIRTTDTAIYTEGSSLSQKKVSDLKQRVKIVNETPGGFLISIHQNTFPDHRYFGAQVFYGGAAGSKEFASQLQSSFATTINPNSNRKCKAAQGIYLMQHIQRPGVLVECGFLSNAEEEARLRSDAYQKVLCIVIAGNLNSYLAS